MLNFCPSVNCILVYNIKYRADNSVLLIYIQAIMIKKFRIC